jgi:hypothetical protein
MFRDSPGTSVVSPESPTTEAGSPKIPASMSSTRAVFDAVWEGSKSR